MSSVKTTNLFKRKLIRELIKLSNKTKKPLWKRVAEELSRPRRKKVAVNLSRINRHAQDKEVVIIPGRVLGAGKLDKKITVIAESFTKKAYDKILESGSKPILLSDLITNKRQLKKIEKSIKRLMI